MTDNIQNQTLRTDAFTHGGYDRQFYDNQSPYDPKNTSLNKDTNIKEPSSSFLKSTSAKVIAIVGVIAGVCLVAGGAAGLAYYLGTLSKIHHYPCLIFLILY
jgi:hypothetical protein